MRNQSRVGTRPPSCRGTTAARARRWPSQPWWRRGPQSGVTASRAQTPASPSAGTPGTTVWDWERKALRTGEAMAVSFPGNLLIAWRRQLPMRTREQRPAAFDRAIEAISQDAPDPISRLLLERRTLELLIRLGKDRRTGVFGVAQTPEHTATDNRGQIHLLGETVAVLFISQEIGGEGQTTPGQNRYDTLVAQGADHTIEGHGLVG